MQADVHEIGRQVLEKRPAAGRVGDDERDALLAQELDEARRHEALVPHLERVAQPPVALDLEVAAAGDAPVVPARELRGVLGRARQGFEKAREAFLVERLRRRQLPQERPELVLEREHARREEIRERRLDALEAQHVCDVARAFDGEHEARRHLGKPARVVLGPLQRVEAAVQLDRREALRGERQLLALRQAGRIKITAPRLIPPARDADECARRHGDA